MTLIEASILLQIPLSMLSIDTEEYRDSIDATDSIINIFDSIGEEEWDTLADSL